MKAGMSALFNDKQELDVGVVLAFVEGLAGKIYGDGMSASIDTRKIASIIRSMTIEFPHKDGIDKASVFKKLANFICFFVAGQPVSTPFPSGCGYDDIVHIPNHENAVFAFLLAAAALLGARIQCEAGEKTITEPIKLSRHSLVDIIEALAAANPQNHFQIVTVLLEQLVYKTNENCQYDTFPVAE